MKNFSITEDKTKLNIYVADTGITVEEIEVLPSAKESRRYYSGITLTAKGMKMLLNFLKNTKVI